MNLKVVFSLVLSAIATPAIANAQVTINTTGVVSGTITPPNRNPNFNQGTTRVDTNAQGQYFRNGVLVYTPPDPRLVGITAAGRYYVDFRGIPVVGIDGTLTSPVLSGELQSINRFNHNTPVKFHGNIQDEFVVRGQYTGTATDPANGNQYQGTFDFSGQGPRYSDRNGGLSPTVFDFQSAYNNANGLPARPTVFSYTFSGMPVQLTVTIPSSLTPINTPGNPTPTPPNTPTLPSTPVPNVPTDLAPSAATSFFEVPRPVLEGERRQTASIGPRSRVLLR
jgi:hypothetical protein